jgi:spoIIIJ-associated protein
MTKPGSIFEGRTLDDAVRKGLEALGLSRAEVMITMLEEGSSGFLGLGARPYKVRIMPRPGGAIPEPGERGEGRRRDREGGGRERFERGHRGGDNRRGGGGGGGTGRDRFRGDRRGSERRGTSAPQARMERGAPPAQQRPPRDGAPGVRDAGGRGDSGPRGDSGGRGEEADRRRRRGRRGGRDRGREGGREERMPAVQRPDAGDMPEMREERAPRTPREEMSASRESREPREHTGPALSPAELEAQGKRWTEDFFKAMGFSATVTATGEADRVDVTASVPEHEELLTGRKGEVRQALQHILNRMINRGEGTRYHLQLEINDFWKKREDELKALAHKLADEAIESQTEAVTEYLNAQERRVIHVALRDDGRVKTYALGSGMIKRLAVAPADFPGAPEDGE